MVSRVAMDAGLLPVKRLDRAKARLGAHFSDDERVEIARALFEDSLDLCSGADFLSWWVVSDDSHVLKEAAGIGMGVVEDDGIGLNEAVNSALREIVAAGAQSVTIVPSDVPLAWRGDLRDLIDTGETSDLVVVPSRKDAGTNALHVRPPDLIEPQFGPGSLGAHVALAERRKLRCTILRLPRLELDIDTIEDVDAYLAAKRHAPSRSADVLSRFRARS